MRGARRMPFDCAHRIFSAEQPVYAQGWGAAAGLDLTLPSSTRAKKGGRVRSSWNQQFLCGKTLARLAFPKTTRIQITATARHTSSGFCSILIGRLALPSSLDSLRTVAETIRVSETSPPTKFQGRPIHSPASLCGPEGFSDHCQLARVASPLVCPARSIAR